MITKERLLAGLDELIEVEEGVITLYANFSKALLKQTPQVDKDKKKEMTKLLSVLYRDSARHKEIIDSMIEDVQKGSKNEY